MAVLLATFSIIVFYSESILLLHQASLHNNDENRQFFFVMLSIFVVSQVLTNTASALLISIRMDFSGKPSGRLLCAFLHLGQQGVIWRLGKLVMFYDKKDWIELVLLRMISIGVQTLPYLAIQSYLLLTSSVEIAMSVISLVVSLTSASIGLTTFTIRNHVNAASWINSTSKSVNSRKHCGYLLLLIGTSLGLASRMCSIILMSVEKLYWIAIPLGIHMVVLLLASLLHRAWNHTIVSWKDVMKLIAFTYFNVFDLTNEYFNKIQCKYVSYYTIILIENIIMTAVWLMSSSVDYTIKLIMILSILTCFICSLILKFTAGGLLFRDISPANNLDDTLDVKPEKYIDNLVRQHSSNTSSTNRRTLRQNGLILHSTHTTSLSEFSQSVANSDDKVTRILKPWEQIPVNTVQCKEKQTGSVQTQDSQIGKHNILNVTSVFDDPVTVSRYKTKINKNSKNTKHSVIKCYVIPQDENKHSLNNFDVHSSNSRNTNTLAPSNITSSQVSNEILTQDSGISRGRRFRFHQYSQAVLSMIKKHKCKLHKKKRKMKLFSPGCDTVFSCETVSECAWKDRAKRASSRDSTSKSCETKIEEFNWDEDITSHSTSTIGRGSSIEICSRRDSFITEFSSTSFSTWPSLHFEYFNPNVFKKQSLNSVESIKHWLEDVHRHTQDVPEGFQGMADSQEMYKSHLVLDEGKEMTDDHQDITEGHTPEESFNKISEEGISQHSNENTIHNSHKQSVSEQCSLNSSTDVGVEDSNEETSYTLSILSEAHIINTNPTGVASSAGLFSSSQESVTGLVLNRTFLLDDTVKITLDQNEQTHCEELSNQPVTFCVKLDNMESLV